VELNLSLDFTGVSAATGGIDILPAGINSGKIIEFAHFDDSNRLYCYMMTDGMRHRESFSLANAGALSFLMAFMQSAGAPTSMFNGKKKVPFHKFVGRNVYFNYTPPNVDAAGKRADGSYPRYQFYTEDRYKVLSEMASAAPAPAAAKPKAAADSAGDDYDFLLDD